MALFVALPTGGCSGDDEEEDATEFGSCNGIAAFSTCTEMEVGAEFIADEQQICIGDGDTWTTEPCPTADLVGCCRSAFADGEVLECYYTGYPMTAMELEELCIDFEGTWTTGSR